MNRAIRGIRQVALGASLLLAAGCSTLGTAGTLGDILGSVMNGGGMGGYGNGNQITAQIDGIDTRGQRIQVRTQDGRTGMVYYDNRTRVVYGQQEYPVTSLERGDVVSMRVQQDQQRNLYTDYITVQQDVRGGAGGTYGNGGYGTDGTYGSGSQQVQRLEGRVNYVDTSRGQFEVSTGYNQRVLVRMPYNSSSADVDRFRRLRSGDNVRLEVIPVNQNQADLYRFLY